MNLGGIGGSVFRCHTHLLQTEGEKKVAIKVEGNLSHASAKGEMNVSQGRSRKRQNVNYDYL